MWFNGASVSAWYINLERRLDRRGQFEREMIDSKALKDISIKRFRAFDVPKNGALGCARSHIAVLRQALADPAQKPFFLVMEDDCQLEIPADELVDVINNMPAPNDIDNPLLCLSYHPPRVRLQGFGTDSLRFGSSVRATEIQTTSAYIVTRLFAETGLLPCFETSERELTRDSSRSSAIDVKWKALQPFSITVPRLIRQRVDHSDITNRVLDYGGGCEMLLRAPTFSALTFKIKATSCFHTTVFPEHVPLKDMLKTALTLFPHMRHFFVCLAPLRECNAATMFSQWLKYMSPIITRPIALFTPPSHNLSEGFFISRKLAEEWVANTNHAHQLVSLCAEKNMHHLTNGWRDCYASVTTPTGRV